MRWRASLNTSPSTAELLGLCSHYRNEIQDTEAAEGTACLMLIPKANLRESLFFLCYKHPDCSQHKQFKNPIFSDLFVSHGRLLLVTMATCSWFNYGNSLICTNEPRCFGTHRNTAIIYVDVWVKSRQLQVLISLVVFEGGFFVVFDFC